MTPADYGTLAMFNIAISVIYIFVSINLDAAIGVEFFNKDKIRFPTYVTNCLLIGTIATICLIPCLYFGGGLIEKYTGVSLQLLWIALSVAFFRYITQILLVIWQSGMRAISFSALQIMQMGADVALTIFFVVMLKMGFQGRVDAILISTFIFAVVAFALLIREKWITADTDLAYAKMAFSFGIPMLPHAFGAIAIGMTDRILLINLVGPEQTGLYFIGFQIGNALNMAVWAFNQAWSPWLFGKLKEGNQNTNRMIVKFTYAYFLMLLALAVALYLATPTIFQFFISDDYKDGIKVVAWTALSSAFVGMYYAVCSYITYAKKTHILSWVTLISGLINLAASYYLITQNGFVGAAQGTLIAYIISFLMTWTLAAKAYPMPWLQRTPS